MMEGSYRCVKVEHGHDNLFTVGIIYYFEKGCATMNNGYRTNYYEDVYAFNRINDDCFILEPATFTKTDLKSGDKVICRDGGERFVLKETMTTHYANGEISLSLSKFNDELKLDRYDCLDIVKVYRDNILIWERKSEKEEQIDIIEKKIVELQEEVCKLREGIKL